MITSATQGHEAIDISPYQEVGNVYVVPTLSTRLNFSVLVQNAWKKLNDQMPFTNQDVIAVALPSAIEPSICKAIDAFPNISLVTATQQTQKSNLVEVFPITPSDASIEAIRIARENSIPLELVDQNIYPSHLVSRTCTQDPEFLDDGFVLKWGVERFMELLTPFVTTPPFRFEPVASWREGHIAKRLRELRIKYRRVLFVCDASLFRGVKTQLHRPPQETDDTLPFELDMEFEIVTPSLSILFRYLDDFPSIVEAYNSEREQGRAADFDKWRILMSLIDRKAKLLEKNISARQFLAFSSYLQNNLIRKKRVTPRPSDIYSAITSSYHPSFAERLVYQLGQYENQINVDRISSETMLGSQESEFVSTHDAGGGGRKKYVSRNCSGATVTYVAEEYKPLEDKEFKDALDSCTWPKWDQYVNKMRRKTRQHVSQNQHFLKIHEYRGSVEAGVDSRKTLRSFWQGKNKIYVKQKKNRTARNVDINEPIIWLFETDHEYRNIDYNCFTVIGSDYVSSQYCERNSEQVYPTNTTSRNTGNGPSVTKIELLGLLTFCDFSLERKDVISRYGGSEKPRIPDIYDLISTVQKLQTVHDNVAWWEKMMINGLAFAEKTLIAILPDQQKLTPNILTAAKKMRKDIFKIPLSSFSQHEVRRLSKLYLCKSLKSSGDDTASVVNPRILLAYEKIMRQFWD